jgi:preprotein translocase subunit SecA
VLAGENLERMILDNLGEVTSTILDTFASDNEKLQNWDLDGMNTALSQQFGLQIDFGDRSQLTAEKVTESVSKAVKEVYDRQKKQLGEFYDQVATMVLLQTIDTKWKEHLEYIDKLKEGINLRAYAQKDPLIEYKKEAFAAFQSVSNAIKSEVVEKFLKIQIVAPERVQEMRQRQLDDSKFDYEGADESEIGALHQPQAPLGGGLPFANRQQAMAAQQRMGPASDFDDDNGLNRAQRRRMKKKKKK